MFFKRQRFYIIVFALAVVFSAVPISQSYPHIEAASVTGITVFNFECSTVDLIKIKVTGNFDTDDGYVTSGGDPLDLFGFRITDATGAIVFESTFGVEVGGTEFNPGIYYGSAHPAQNPLTARAYEAVDYSGFGALLGSVTFNSPCLPPAPDAPPIAQGFQWPVDDPTAGRFIGYTDRDTQ